MNLIIFAVTVLLCTTCSLVSGEAGTKEIVFNDPDDSCADPSDPKCQDVEKVQDRPKRQVGPPPAEDPSIEFEFIDYAGMAADDIIFSDLLYGAKNYKKLYHTITPDGFAKTDRKFLLTYKPNSNPTSNEYPPWTYRGFYDKKIWHKIPIDRLMRKRNKSFMLLEHECESETDRGKEKNCAESKYGTLPSCNSDDFSPIDISTKKARDSSLKEFRYRNLWKNSTTPTDYDFILSVPWDGTDLLTLELLNDPVDNKRAPGVTKGSISGNELFLERIHIHYGENETLGSEHTVDGKPYSMELQFIWTSTKSETEPVKHDDKQYWELLMNYYTSSGKTDRYKNVHAIAMFVQVYPDAAFHKYNEEDKWNKEAAEAFQVVSAAARKFWAIHNIRAFGNLEKKRGVKSGANSTTMIKLGAFYPPRQWDTKSKKLRDSIYYNYKGALTHPPCFSYIEWDVYQKPLIISTSMWQDFLYIPSEFDDSTFIAGNYRTNRSVYVKNLDKEAPGVNNDVIEKTKKKIAKRDLRRSKPADSNSDDNYDYYNDDKGAGSRILLYWSKLGIIISFIFTITVCIH